jgi:hypothetical protein
MWLGIAGVAFAASSGGRIACAVPAQAKDTIKIGYIDALSGGGMTSRT